MQTVSRSQVVNAVDAVEEPLPPRIQEGLIPPSTSTGSPQSSIDRPRKRLGLREADREVGPLLLRRPHEPEEALPNATSRLLDSVIRVERPFDQRSARRSRSLLHFLHPPRFAVHIPRREQDGNRNRQVVQRRQGFRIHYA